MKPEAALEAAMLLFWAEGYDGASIDRICVASGMPRASLYQDFGGKEGLFLAAIAHYARTRVAPIVDALGPRGALEADLSAFFAEVVALATSERLAPGCLISCVLADVAGANDGFRTELDQRFTALEDRIARRLDHEAPAPENPARAGMLAAVARGIMLRARSGARSEDLHAVSRMAVLGMARTLS